MKKYMIEHNNKFFTGFGNDYNKRGKPILKPIYGSRELALRFYSLNDAFNTSLRVSGSIVEIETLWQVR